jgi:hypothetical protein
MANFNRLQTIINASFKGLSVFNIVVAATRLGLQYDRSTHRTDYVTVTFLLVVEASVALVMASISSYRIVLLDYLAERRFRRQTTPLTPTPHRAGGRSTKPIEDELLDLVITETEQQHPVSKVTTLEDDQGSNTTPVR